MKIGESAENYLETILILEKKSKSVRSVDIASELDFSKPSVSVAMKNLRELGYIVSNPDSSISLTETGREIAEKVYEKHKHLTDWLIALGVSPDVAVADACKIEHVISNESFEAFKRHATQMNFYNGD